MNLRAFLAELKRRNVHKVAVSYTAVSWLVIQVVTQTFPFIGAPNWAVRMVMLLLAIGFPVALVLAWEFELTPEGFKRTEALESASSSSQRRRAWIYMVIVTALLAAGLLALQLRGTKPGVTTPTVTIPVTPTPVTAPISEKSIAVLPLENLSDDKENAYFADGIQDDVLGSLARIKALKVISRSSVMSYRDVGKRNLREIGQQLGVAHILEGSVRRAADRVLVSVHLISTQDSREVWAERYDRTLADSLTLQGELATEITTALSATLSPEEKTRVETKPTNNPEAYLLYLRGRDYETRDYALQNTQMAVTFYTEAITQDPAFALAQARLSMILTFFQITFQPTIEIAKRARSAAEEAVRLRPELGEGHLARALCYYRLDRNFPAALEELKIAERFLPNNAEVIWNKGRIHRGQGHWREALAEFETALRLDPRNFLIAQDPYSTQIWLRNWPAAASGAEATLVLVPDSRLVLTDIADIYLYWKGDIAPLRAAAASLQAQEDIDGDITYLRWDTALLDRDFFNAERAINESKATTILAAGTHPMPRSYFLGCVALVQGDTIRAHELFESALPTAEADLANTPLDPYCHAYLGLLHAYLGRKEEAIREGRRAVELCHGSATRTPLVAAKLAEILVRVGEADEALSMIESDLSVPGYHTLQELRLRWFWDPLRSNPRFQKILNSPEPKTIY